MLALFFFFLILCQKWKMDCVEILSDTCDIIHHPPAPAVLVMLDLHWLYAASPWCLCISLPRAASHKNERDGVGAGLACSSSGAPEWHCIYWLKMKTVQKGIFLGRYSQIHTALHWSLEAQVTETGSALSFLIAFARINEVINQQNHPRIIHSWLYFLLSDCAPGLKFYVMHNSRVFQLNS